MTKEELKQEAEEYAEGMAKYYASTHEDYIPSQFEKYLRNAYISSAEPREKRIAELDCQKNRNKFCYSCANATERCFRNEIGCPCDKYKSYKEENAELKKKNLDTQDAVTMQMYTNKANKEIADRQLTKAKELLERLLITSCNSDVLNLLPNCSEALRVRVEAEQFLNSEVEK